MAAASYVSASVKRQEDPVLLRGEAHFIGDLRLPGLLAVKFVRSPHAHARLLGIDAREALALPGVETVVSGADLASTTRPIRAIMSGAGYQETGWLPLAQGKVRFVGEPVAAVVAADQYRAEDALDAIRVFYDPLPAVADVEATILPDAPRVHDELPGNALFFHTHFENGNVQQALGVRRAAAVRDVPPRPVLVCPDGAPRRHGVARSGGGDPDRVGIVADAAPAPQRAGGGAGDAGVSAARALPVGRRRVRAQDASLSRRRGGGGPGTAAQAARALDRGSPREPLGERAGPRPRQSHRGGRAKGRDDPGLEVDADLRLRRLLGVSGDRLARAPHRGRDPARARTESRCSATMPTRWPRTSARRAPIGEWGWRSARSCASAWWT